MKVKVNNNKTYDLVRWNAQEFNNTLTLLIITTDLADVQDTFGQITRLDVVNENNNIISTYSYLDSYSGVSLVRNVQVENERRFVDAISITLTKTNIVDVVNRLDEQINPVIDIDSMTVEELKEYKLSEVSADCEADVCAGETVELPNGDRKKFQYKYLDQINLNQLMMFALTNPEISLFPYHSSKNSCEFYDRASMLAITTTLTIRKIRLTTYCNQLKMYIRSLENLEDLKGIYYGMELPQEYQDVITEIVSGTIEEMGKIINEISGTDGEDN